MEEGDKKVRIPVRHRQDKFYRLVRWCLGVHNFFVDLQRRLCVQKTTDFQEKPAKPRGVNIEFVALPEQVRFIDRCGVGMQVGLRREWSVEGGVLL